MAGQITKASLDALRVQIELIFQSGFEQTSTWYPELATEISSGAESNVYPLIDLALDLREWIGERDLRALQESDYTLKNKHFEGTITLNRDKIEDDVLDFWMRTTVPMLGMRAAKWHDRQLANILLNNAVAYDSEQFFDPNHNNSGTAALATDGTTFNDTRAAMRSFLDPAGAVRDVGDRFALVVAPQLERVARTIVEAEWGPVVPTATAVQHATNVQKGFASVVVVPELAANPNRWFIFAVGLPIKAFLVQTRTAPEIISIDSKAQGGPPFLSNENVYGVDFRSAYGVTLPWLAFANDPDGAMT